MTGYCDKACLYVMLCVLCVCVCVCWLFNLLNWSSKVLLDFTGTTCPHPGLPVQSELSYFSNCCRSFVSALFQSWFHFLSFTLSLWTLNNSTFCVSSSPPLSASYTLIQFVTRSLYSPLRHFFNTGIPSCQTPFHPCKQSHRPMLKSSNNNSNDRVYLFLYTLTMPRTRSLQLSLKLY